MNLSREQVIEMLPAYVLGALEPDEMLAVDQYITEHQELLLRLERAEDVTVQLAQSSPMVPLPADGKSRLMARVRVESTPAKMTTPTTSAPQKMSTSPAVPNWLEQLQSFFWPLNGWAAATLGAILLLIGLGFYAAQTQQQVEQATAEIELLQEQVIALQTDNDELLQQNQILNQQIQGSKDRLLFIANTLPDETILIPGTEEAPQAIGMLYQGPADQSLLMLQGLTPLSEEQTYQLWFIPADEAPQPAGLMTVNPDRPTWFDIEVAPEIQDFAAIGVSIEPTGGSTAPTGPIVLLGTKS